MENEHINLAALGAEIAEMRKSLVEMQGMYTSAVSSSREAQRGFNDKVSALRAEFAKALQSLEDEKNRVASEVARIQAELRKQEQEIEEKNKLYAKLIEEQDNAKEIELLKKTMDDICAEFDAYFKAHVYQHEDLAATIKAYRDGKNGMLNANGLGLGKTYESIVSLYIMRELFKQEHGRNPRILWLTKKSLVSSTPREINKWWPECKVARAPANQMSEQERNFFVEIGISVSDIILVNYEFVRTTSMVRDITWDLVVIDEVHKLKGGANKKPTAIWVAIKDVCIKARFTLMLSGTPMVNKPEEMWSYLHIFSPERFPDIKHFERNFSQVKNIAGEMKQVIDADRLLRMALKGQMIRRTAKEVGLQMPELNREFVELEMNPEQANVYQQMRTRFFVWLDSQQETMLSAAAIIAQLTRLRQINVWPAGIKLKDAETEKEIHLDVQDSSKIDYAMDLIEQNNDPTVVFCTFNEPMYEIRRRCRELGLTCEVISGESVTNMGKYEEAFQQGNLDVLCINSAMGEGLNLQKSDNWPGGSNLGIFLDWWWTPARNEQCEGRIYRQGATVPVMIKVLENLNSIDSFIFAKNMEKAAAFADIMDSKAIRPASEWREYLQGVL